MPLTQLQEDTEHQLKVAAMTVDVSLETRQSFWETPRNLVVIIGGIAAATAAIAGAAGYKFAQSQPPIQTIIVQLPPGFTVVPTAPPAKP